MSFINNLGFVIGDCSTSKVERLLEKAKEISLRWGASNLITYDMSKTETILFCKACHQKLAKQLLETQIRFSGETIFFNKKVTRWLGVWLDSHFNFATHVNERMKKAKAVELRIVKRLRKTHGLYPALV